VPLEIHSSVHPNARRGSRDLWLWQDMQFTRVANLSSSRQYFLFLRFKNLNIILCR
jgi:hypothetical protein